MNSRSNIENYLQMAMATEEMFTWCGFTPDGITSLVILYERGA